MAYSKANMRAVDRYVKANYDTIIIRVPKGRKTAVEAFAASKGLSVNAFINGLLWASVGFTEDDWKKESPSE